MTAMQVIADNLQITRPEIEAALFDGDPEPIRSLARNLEAAGADGIDINSGPLPRNPESGIRHGPARGGGAVGNQLPAAP